MAAVEMTNQRYGHLTVLYRVDNDKHGQARWLCRCDCGADTTALGAHLRSGNTKSCGCLSAAEDISGRRFGRLIALQAAPRRGNHAMWHFVCDCGTEVVARKSHVKSGATSSCGCLAREESVKRFTTHGMTGSPEYNTWNCMLARCEYTKHPQYKDYGGRGIKVCERWHSFEEFYADVGHRPPGLTLDRIDNDGHYEPGNVRWATWVEQAKSRRKPSR